MDDASITALNLELTAKNYTHLLEKTNNIDDLTREILNEWNITDKANYFNDATKIAEAKAYASYLLNDTVVEWVSEAVALTRVGDVIKMSDYAKIAKLINKWKTDDLVKLLSNRLWDEWEAKNLSNQLIKEFKETNKLDEVKNTDVAKLVWMSEKNTEAVLITFTKTLAQDKEVVSALVALKDKEQIAKYLTEKCNLGSSNVAISSESELVQKLASADKTQDVQKALEFTSKWLLLKQIASWGVAIFAIAWAVMSIYSTYEAFAAIWTTNNDKLKGVYRARWFGDAWFAAIDVATATSLSMDAAYYIFSVWRIWFMSTGVGTVVVLAAQAAKYLFDQYSLGAEFQAKNAEDWQKEWAKLFDIWYYRSGWRTSWENVKNTFGTADMNKPLDQIVDGLISLTLGIQGKPTADQLKIKTHMKEYMHTKYSDKIEHREDATKMFSEAIEYATFCEYVAKIKTSGTAVPKDIHPDMQEFLSKYAPDANMTDMVNYFSLYKGFLTGKENERLQEYNWAFGQYSQQELIYVYEQMARYDQYYTLSPDGRTLMSLLAVYLTKKYSVDVAKLPLNLQEPPVSSQAIEKFIASKGKEKLAHESVSDVKTIKWKTDWLLITDEMLIETYDVAPDIETYAFYKYAKIFGFTGSADLSAIKSFLSETSKDQHGVYWDGKQWNLNNTHWFDTWLGTWSQAVENLKVRTSSIDFDDKYLWLFDDAGIKAKFDVLRDDISKKLDQVKNYAPKAVSKAEIINYVKQYPGQYVTLSIDLLSRLLQKHKLKNMWHYLFSFQNNALVALPLDGSKEKPYFVDSLDTERSTQLDYGLSPELKSVNILEKLTSRTKELRTLIYADNDHFHAKQNVDIEKIITNKEAELLSFAKNITLYEPAKQKELFAKKQEEVEIFYQSFLISFLSQSADHVLSHDVNSDDSDEKILQSTKYGEWSNFNTVIVNKYKEQYMALQLTNPEMKKLQAFEYGTDYINYYYRSLSLAMFKSYVLKPSAEGVHTKLVQSLDILEVQKYMKEMKSYKDYVSVYKSKVSAENFVAPIDQKITTIAH